MDGTGSPEDLFDATDGLSGPLGIALDIAAGKVYWGDAGASKIQRGNMDGTGAPEDLFDETDGLEDPRHIALDIAAGKVYWVDRFPDKIQRGNMDGTGSPEDLFDNPTDGLQGPLGIALDLTPGAEVVGLPAADRWALVLAALALAAAGAWWMRRHRIREE